MSDKQKAQEARDNAHAAVSLGIISKEEAAAYIIQKAEERAEEDKKNKGKSDA